ncbi:unnamed protein product [Cylindrotheca closterium]|uniref:DDE Tnp4 domain-containing protein n=1 Tax=Cylindrotheca closterium TaxID=2856 RepID=A0AAD2FN89_9STRA|nr:unnamed protein product [Cylindrotheca closterium]
MMNIALRHRGYTVRRIKRAKGKTNAFSFKHNFGVSPCTAVWVYTDMQLTNIADAKIKGGEEDLKYFLMGRYYLRTYPTEEDLSATINFLAGWARTKTWAAIAKIRMLKKFSFLKAGLDYELGISLVDNRLLWIRGPFPAETNDITVLREEGLLAELKRRKQSAICDKGYNGEPNNVSTCNSHDNAGAKLFKSRALKGHEIFNNLLKQNNILDTRFRHNETKFRDAFEARCVLAQYRI